MQVIILLLCILAIIPYLFFPKSKKNLLQKYDAIVILGCPMVDESTYSNAQLKRMRHAIQLYQANVAITIIISGGAVKNAYNEAQGMAKYLKVQLPMAHIEVEEQARNTYQNMKLTKQAFPQYQHIVVVSSRSHERRATFFLNKFYTQSIVWVSDEKDSWYYYLWEYTRIWVALYWEIRLSRMKTPSQE